MKRSDKKEFVQKLKDEIDTSSSVIVAHYSGLTVNESELTSFDIIEPTLFITPTELFSDNPCPIGIVENCIL